MQGVDGQVYPAGTIEFLFKLTASGSGLMSLLDDSLFLMDFEKKLHGYLFDESLTEFFHVHPQYEETQGSWALQQELPVDGHYFFWVEGIVQGPSQTEVLKAGSTFRVLGGQPAHEKPALLLEQLSVSDQGSGAEIEFLDELQTGRSVTFRVRFWREDGSIPQLGQYLGTSLHVTGASLASGEMVHAHGMVFREQGQDVVYVSAVFPEAGSYRLWLQFVESEVLRTVPLSFEVRE